MKSAPIPDNEEARLEALASYQLIDTLPEDVYEDIIQLAAQICRTPISHIGLMDRDQQRLIVKHGLDVDQAPRNLTFCSHAILNPNEMLIVNDARLDERFHDNPFTTGEAQIVFYAGVPLVNPEGYPLGTLCVIDHRPRTLTDNQLLSLKALGKWVSNQFELRKAKLELAVKEQTLKRTHQAIATAKHTLHTTAIPLVETILEKAEHLATNSTDAQSIQELLRHDAQALKTNLQELAVTLRR